MLQAFSLLITTTALKAFEIEMLNQEILHS